MSLSAARLLRTFTATHLGNESSAQALTGAPSGESAGPVARRTIEMSLPAMSALRERRIAGGSSENGELAERNGLAASASQNAKESGEMKLAEGGSLSKTA